VVADLESSGLLVTDDGGPLPCSLKGLAGKGRHPLRVFVQKRDGGFQATPAHRPGGDSRYRFAETPRGRWASAVIYVTMAGQAA